MKADFQLPKGETEKKSVLIVTSVASMIDQFLIPNITLLIEMGFQVDVAANFFHGNTCTEEAICALQIRLGEMGVGCCQIDFDRNAFHILRNMRAYWQTEQVIRQKKYAFVHCHSPIGGILGRIAAKRNGIKTVYTAHGFHFYKDAPLRSWLIYYPLEKYMSKLTDVLITINREDYQRAKKQFYAKKIYYIPGVGIDIRKFVETDIDRRWKRKGIGLAAGDIMLLSVGELNSNKNHEIVIDALKDIRKADVNLFRRAHFFIAGKGKLRERLLKRANTAGVNLHLLGFREDISELLKAADLFLLSSKREGLNVGLMEAMAAKCPVLCSDIRGNRELVRDPRFRFPALNKVMLTEKLLLWRDGTLVPDVDENFNRVKRFDKKIVEQRMQRIYGWV